MHSIYVTGPSTSVTEHFSINLCAFPATNILNIYRYVPLLQGSYVTGHARQWTGQKFEFEGNFKDGPISQECCRHFDKKVRFHLLN